MSKWVRGIYNSAANFVLSRSLRAASGRTMDRNRKQLRDDSVESVKPNKSGEPCQSDERNTSTHGCPRHTTRTCNCTHGQCIDSDLDREYNEFAEFDQRDKDRIKHTFIDPEFGVKSVESGSGAGTIRTEGQGAGSRIRYSNEFGDSQRSSNATGTNVEHTTGIPTGVTI